MCLLENSQLAPSQVLFNTKSPYTKLSPIAKSPVTYNLTRFKVAPEKVALTPCRPLPPQHSRPPPYKVYQYEGARCLFRLAARLFLGKTANFETLKWEKKRHEFTKESNVFFAMSWKTLFFSANKPAHHFHITHFKAPASDLWRLVFSLAIKIKNDMRLNKAPWCHYQWGRKLCQTRRRSKCAAGPTDRLARDAG